MRSKTIYLSFLQVEPSEIFRIVKHESTPAVSDDEDVEDLNGEIIEHDKQTARDIKVKLHINFTAFDRN